MASSATIVMVSLPYVSAAFFASFLRRRFLSTSMAEKDKKAPGFFLVCLSIWSMAANCRAVCLFFIRAESRY